MRVPEVLPDPRRFLTSVDELAQPFIDLAQTGISALTGSQASAAEDELRALFVDAWERRDHRLISIVLGAAPSITIYRQLWRRAAEAYADSGKQTALRLFALPIVLITGSIQENTLSCVLNDNATLTAILRSGKALSGVENFTVSNVLVGASALSNECLANYLNWLQPASLAQERNLKPDPIELTAQREAVYLRFLIGSAVVGPKADFFTSDNAKWKKTFNEELIKQMSVQGVLPLVRSPQALPIALHQGQSAQREISWQLFLSNALRDLRIRAGEPSAVLSSHRCDAGSGEIRVSLSSPFDERFAEGFRCPLYPMDRVEDVQTMLIDLLRDCRVSEIRVLDSIYPDRDTTTNGPLFMRPEIEAKTTSVP